MLPGRRKSMPRRKRAALTVSRLRSAVTNGSAVLDGVDHRSAWMRRFRDLIAQHVADMGGDDAISQSELVLIRRAAMLTLQLEMIEARWAANNNGEASPSGLLLYQQTSSALRRLLETLGLKRRVRDITPDDPLDYAREHA
jgi:hypothetical protein